MAISKLKLGSTLMTGMGFYTIVMGLLMTFSTEIVAVSDFLAYTGTQYADYLANSPIYAEFYIITKKLVSIMMLSAGILIVLVCHFSYEKGEKWSWFALLITGSLIYGTFVVYKIYIGYYGGSMIMFVIGLALTVLGAAIPAKEIVGKSST